MRQIRTSRLVAAGYSMLLLLVACGGGGGDQANLAPTASAGPAQSVATGAGVTLNGSASSDPDGFISSYAWTQTGGAVVALTGATTARPTFVAPFVSSAAVLTFRLVVTDDEGTASAPSTVAITVSPLVVGDATITGQVRFARVPYSSSSPFGLNYLSPQMRPARGVIVRATSGASTLAETATDSSGNYSLTVGANTPIIITVVARMQRGSAQPLPRWDVRVQDGITGNAPYTYNTASFNSSNATLNIDIPLGISSNGLTASGRASGPFAILDTLYTAMQKVLTVAPTADFPELIIDWGTQTEGTHFFQPTSGTQYIRLLSDLSEDADEYDQHVVAHEFGHYIEYNFSRSDSIGGRHALGDNLDMRVAFGEGFGYAFAGMVLDDPVMRDSFVNNGTQTSGSFNAESSLLNGCWCNERSVASILWDLYDLTPDGSDNVAVPFSAIWDALVNQQRVTPAFTSIFTFIRAIKDSQPAFATAINTLVSAQSITASTIDAFATTEANAPAGVTLPLYANITKGGGAVTVRSSSVNGYYNKAGNRGFLRFTPAQTGPVTVSLATTNLAADRDPDFVVWSAGVPVKLGWSVIYPETQTFNVTAGQTYLIDAYDCANGCSFDDAQTRPPGTPGDYTLTVTIN